MAFQDKCFESISKSICKQAGCYCQGEIKVFRKPKRGFFQMEVGRVPGSGTSGEGFLRSLVFRFLPSVSCPQSLSSGFSQAIGIRVPSSSIAPVSNSIPVRLIEILPPGRLAKKTSLPNPPLAIRLKVSSRWGP